MATKGRPTLYVEKMMSNGLPVTLDKWFRDEAKSRNVGYSALKRDAMQQFMELVELERPVIFDTPAITE